MSKAVLISIQPKWCELIASGKKAIEIRKSRPKLKTPFKCYIYCTRSKKHRNLREVDEAFGGGKVIGEFVCDRVFSISVYTSGTIQGYSVNNLNDSCVPYVDIVGYIGRGSKGAGWHISDLVIYDKPKDLSEFAAPKKCPYNAKNGCTYKYHCYRAGEKVRCGSFLERAPQSWCYVEELPGGAD